MAPVHRYAGMSLSTGSRHADRGSRVLLCDRLWSVPGDGEFRAVLQATWDLHPRPQLAARPREHRRDSQDCKRSARGGLVAALGLCAAAVALADAGGQGTVTITTHDHNVVLRVQHGRVCGNVWAKGIA